MLKFQNVLMVKSSKFVAAHVLPHVNQNLAAVRMPVFRGVSVQRVRFLIMMALVYLPKSVPVYETTGVV